MNNEQHILCLNLPHKLTVALIKYGICTLGQLFKASNEELSKVPCVSRSGILKINNALYKSYD